MNSTAGSKQCAETKAKAQEGVKLQSGGEHSYTQRAVVKVGFISSPAWFCWCQSVMWFTTKKTKTKVVWIHFNKLLTFLHLA